MAKKQPPIKTEIDSEEAAIAVASSSVSLPPDESSLVDEPIQAEAIGGTDVDVVDLPVEAIPDKKTRPGFAQLVSVKLVGARTAVLNGKSVLKGEVHKVAYGAYLYAKAHHPQKFAVRYQGDTRFSVEEE